MEDYKALQQERTEIFHAVLDSTIPKRVPIDITLSLECVVGFGGQDLVELQWKPGLIEEAADQLCRTLYTDLCPLRRPNRYPSFYEILQSQSFVMGMSGLIQHPEVMGMSAEDYDYLIAKPYDCLLERVLPRHYRALDPQNPTKMMLHFAKSFAAFEHNNKLVADIRSKLIEKYGYFPGLFKTMTAAPFDFIADQLRGFKEISMDIRRIPEKLAEACEAVYPIVFKKGLPDVITPYSTVIIPLHMPPYMREKDFERLWWPSFKKMLDHYASLGVHAYLFCEHDFTRYLDYLYELPVNTLMQFEYGDPKLIKEKLGDKHIITGFYPLTMLKTHSKEQCLAKAAELVEILAPGGKYMFTTDKNPLVISDFKMENLCAVTDYVREQAVYANPGEPSGLKFKQEDYYVDPSSVRTMESQYFTGWEQYKSINPQLSDYAKPALQEYEEALFRYITHLLI